MVAATSNNVQSILVILRREYYNLTHDHCAAKLIEYFSHWRKWKIKNHRTEWVYMPIRQIIDDLMGEHSYNVIRRSIDILRNLGILERRNNPGNWQDKTYQYRLDVAALERLIKNEDREIRNDQPSVSTENREIRSDQHLQDPNLRSDINITSTIRASEDLIDSQKEDQEVAHTGTSDQSKGAGVELQSKPGKPIKVECQVSTHKPTVEELRHAINEIGELPVTPSLIVSEAVQAMLIKHWSNALGAIAYTKEAIKTWKKPARCWEAVLIDALKKGKKPEPQRERSLGMSEPPTKLVQWFLNNRDKCKDLYFSSLDGCWMVVLKNGFTRLNVNQLD